jgi:hypothetical protein
VLAIVFLVALMLFLLLLLAVFALKGFITIAGGIFNARLLCRLIWLHMRASDMIRDLVLAAMLLMLLFLLYMLQTGVIEDRRCRFSIILES